MAVVRFNELSQGNYDVVICGGGLAGLTLARQLRRTHPALSVVVVERSSRPLPDAAHKVGESSVELGSAYLEKLGLREYLVERHLFKHGLRFYPGGGKLPLEQRTEIGPAQEPIVPSYQLDRGRLETDLRGMLEDDGVTLIEGATVSEIKLGAGDEAHKIDIARGDEKATLSARWVVDATGRKALLRRSMKLTRGNNHEANASWFRITGKLDITTLAPAEAEAWHNNEWAQHRWRSTNHLMGEGYWAWIIPLSTGNTSIGLVVHDSVHPFEKLRTLERTKAFLAEHEPVLAKALESFEVLDFGCLKSYSNNVARAWSPDRWAIVGEAGAFVDPLYSPGTDYIAFANSFTEELIRVDLAGGDLDTRARELNVLYRSLVRGNVDLYRDAAKVQAHPSAMLMKVYWDNFSYWSYPCQLFQQELYRLTEDDMGSMVTLGMRWVELTGYVQALVTAWATHAPEGPRAGFFGMPAFPSVLIDAHLAMRERFTPEQALAYIASRLAEGEEIAAELLVRTLLEVGDERAQAVFDAAGVAKWTLAVDEARIGAEATVGLARRRALRPLVRDVERSLGRVRGDTSEATLRALLKALLVTREPVSGEPEPVG